MRMALLGASGCGKSVTLKCIAGIMTPDRGHIILNGETLFDSEKHINLPPPRVRVPENTAPGERTTAVFNILADKCLCYK